MDGFTFYKSFYETMKKIRKRNEREKISLAILEYMFDEIEPENLSEGGEIAFESFRRTLDISRVRGKSGETQKENKKKSNENQKENKIETNEIKDETSSSLSYSLSLINPPISPLTRGEGEEKSAKIEFFEKYPALKVKRCKDDGIDYSVLIREFEQSSMLRGMYSFTKVASMYTAIERGDFRDKPKSVNQAVADANARADRDRWYSERQARAEAVAYGFQKTAKGNKRFCEIEREIARMNLEIAKAEVAGSDSLIGLREYQDQLKEERLRILSKLGIDENQLVPQYACEKCNDTGYMQDGRACDCYKP